MTFLLRDLPDLLHRQAKALAAISGISLKSWIIEAIKEKIERDN
jgi:predicted HicB family RNase H-like nuclease